MHFRNLILFCASSIFVLGHTKTAAAGEPYFTQVTSRDTLITRQFFGFDFWSSDVRFWNEVFAQLQQDSLWFGLVGVDALTWELVEPDPPANGIHRYDWQVLDAAFAAVAATGKVLELTVRPVSRWGTVVAVNDMPGDPCCRMSPPKEDAASDTTAWGMTAYQAWYDFVFNLVERYDGDGVEDAPGVDRPAIRHLMLGNEPEAPEKRCGFTPVFSIPSFTKTPAI